MTNCGSLHCMTWSSRAARISSFTELAMSLPSVAGWRSCIASGMVCEVGHAHQLSPHCMPTTAWACQWDCSTACIAAVLVRRGGTTRARKLYEYACSMDRRNYNAWCGILSTSMQQRSIIPMCLAFCDSQMLNKILMQVVVLYTRSCDDASCSFHICAHSYRSINSRCPNKQSLITAGKPGSLKKQSVWLRGLEHACLVRHPSG